MSMDGWHDMGNPVANNVNQVIDDITVGQNADGRLEVFGSAESGQMWHCWQVAANGLWSNWARLGGLAESGFSLPAVGANRDGRLDVFAVQNRLVDGPWARPRYY